MDIERDASVLNADLEIPSSKLSRKAMLFDILRETPQDRSIQ